MFDPQRMLGQMLGGALGGAFGGSRKRSRGLLGTGSAMKAQVGIGLLGVAFAAYEHFQQQRGGFAAGSAPSDPSRGGAFDRAPAARTMPPPPPGAALAMPPPVPTGTRGMPPSPPSSPRAMPPPPPRAFAAVTSMADSASAEASPTSPSDAIVVMRAMIAAAAADGRIDDDERARIIERATSAGVDAHGLKFLDSELAAPKPLESIAAETRPAIAEDVYAASLLAISLDTAQEREYLDRLARALALDDGQRAQIHSRLGFAGNS